MKKVALLAPYFLPRRRVGSWRPFKFAIHLREFGWEPHIITIKDTKGELTPKEADLLSGIPVYEIQSPFDLTHKIGRQLEFNGKVVLEQKEVSKTTKNRLRPALSWVDKHFPIDTWLPLFWLRKRKIAQYIAQIDPDLLWSTGDPWSSHWLAKQLVDTCQVPWIADFRDPWTLGDINLKKRSDFACQIDRRQEKDIIQDATMLTFTSRQTENLYENTYGSLIEKSATIYNSFDSALFNHKNSAKEFFDDAYLNLIFFGKFRPLSPARPLIDILHQLYEMAPRYAQKVRVHSFGSLSREEASLAKAKGVYENFISFKPIALEDGLSVLTQADILWLSTHPSREHIIPAKLWDYLAAKRPIFSIAPNPEIKNILYQTGAGIQFDIGDTATIVNCLGKAVCSKKSGGGLSFQTAVDDHAIKQYDADVATKKLASIFDRLT